METTKTDIYQKITDSIISAMETASKWNRPWTVSVADGAPINASSRKAYRGVNTLVLWATAQEKAYQSTQWATYRQWSELGAQVRKGEKATSVVFWSTATKKESQDGEESTFMYAKQYSVFNASQVDGFEETAVTKPVSTNERIADADGWFMGLCGDVRHGGNRACYMRTADRIEMPEFESFTDSASYYST